MHVYFYEADDRSKQAGIQIFSTIEVAEARHSEGCGPIRCCDAFDLCVELDRVRLQYKLLVHALDPDLGESLNDDIEPYDVS